MLHKDHSERDQRQQSLDQNDFEEKDSQDVAEQRSRPVTKQIVHNPGRPVWEDKQSDRNRRLAYRNRCISELCWLVDCPVMIRARRAK